VVFSACCFGAIPILTTLSTRAGASLGTTLAWRYLLAAAMLAPVARFGALRRAGRRAFPLLIVTGAGQAAIAFVSLSALRYIPAATLTFLFYTYPSWVAIMAIARHTERLTPLRTAALVLSLVGIATMVGSPFSGGLHPIGVLLALTSALLYATYIPLLDHLRGDLAPPVASVYITLGAGVILWAVATIGGDMSVHLTTTSWAAIGGLALFSTALAFIAFLRGLRVLGPVRSAIASTVEPFCTALLGALVLGQHIGFGTVIGGVLIAVSVVLLQLR
jgi:drug/metabolite transporter (DMT)-like permease